MNGRAAERDERGQPTVAHAEELAAIAERLHELAASTGAPEALYALADHGNVRCGHALYGFGAALTLALGDLALDVEVAERAARRRAALP